jgi:hypothetical protein
VSGQPDDYQQSAFDLAAGRDGLVRLHVTGLSMSPLLRPGDVVIVQPVEANTLRTGDVIVLRRASDVVTHRLIAVDARGWQAKGDSTSLADAPVAAQAIVGRVAAFERGGARVDLQSRRHVAAGRWLGRIGLWESRWADAVGARAHPRLARGALLPFRAMTRIVVWLLGR